MADDDRSIGFVYVWINPAFPDRVKAGETGLLAKDRAKNLYKTDVPEPYQVAFVAMTSRRKRVEAMAHQRLGDLRPNTNQEFFRVTQHQAPWTMTLASSIVPDMRVKLAASHAPHKDGYRQASTDLHQSTAKTRGMNGPR